MQIVGQFLIAIGVGSIFKFYGYDVNTDSTLLIAILAIIIGFPLVIQGVITTAIKEALNKEEE